MNMIQEWNDFADECIIIWMQHDYSPYFLDRCRTEFFPVVADHIEHYVIPQYSINDTLSLMPPEQAVVACEYAIKKYKARKGNNQRPYNDGRDCVKRAHYAQLMMKYRNRGVFTPEDTLEVWDALIDYLKLENEERKHDVLQRT